MEKINFFDKFHLLGGFLFNKHTEESSEKIYKRYLVAGSTILCVHPESLISDNIQQPNTVNSVTDALTLPNQIIGESNAAIALVLSPPTKQISHNFDEIYDIYADIAVAAEDNGADLIILNDFHNLFDVKTALIALKENATLPVAVMLPQKEKEEKLSAAMAVCVSSAGADLIGLEASGPIPKLCGIIDSCREFTALPLILCIEGEASEGIKFSGIDSALLEQLNAIISKYGIAVIGGGRLSGPRHIEQLSQIIHEDLHSSIPGGETSCITTASTVFMLNTFNIVGVPSAAAVGKNAVDKALSEAKRLSAEGADIFCLSAQRLGITTEDEMTNAIHILQAETNLPLIIDCDNLSLSEAALWAYEGKPGLLFHCKDAECAYDFIELAHRFGAAFFACVDTEETSEEGEHINFKKKHYIAGMLIDTWRLKKHWWYRDIIIGTSTPNKNPVNGLKQVLSTLKRIHLNFNCTSFCNCTNTFGESQHMSEIGLSFATHALDRGCRIFFAENGLSCLRKAADLYLEINKN